MQIRRQCILSPPQMIASIVWLNNIKINIDNIDCFHQMNPDGADLFNLCMRFIKKNQANGILCSWPNYDY